MIVFTGLVEHVFLGIDIVAYCPFEEKLDQDAGNHQDCNMREIKLHGLDLRRFYSFSDKLKDSDLLCE